MNTRLILRHTLMGIIGAAVVRLFWLRRPDWSAKMRFWRAVGDAGFMLLIAALASGPLARLWPNADMKIPVPNGHQVAATGLGSRLTV